MLVVCLSLLAQGVSALVVSPILLGPDRLLSPSTAALANTPERCGKTPLPMWEADCTAAQLCCFPIPSRGTVGNAKHPGPRQSVIRTSYVPSTISPASTMSSRNYLPHNTSAICLKVSAVFNFRRSTPFPMPNNRDVVSHPAIVWANGSKRHTSEPNARCREWMSHTIDFAFFLPSDR